MQINNINQVDISNLNKTVSLIIPAQNAKLSPPVGPILGQVKIKVKNFCTLFNDSTKTYQENFPIRTLVFVYKSEKFHYLLKTPSTAFLLKNLQEKNNKKNVSLLDIYKIMLIKKLDTPEVPEQIIFRNVLSIAKSINIQIK